jgi:hypothetical protein
VTQWFEYAAGRAPTDADACTLASMHQAFAAAGYDLRELMVSLTQADAFTRR